MKILYFHQHFVTPEGSTGTRSYEFSRALIAAGHQVTMVCGQFAHQSLKLPYDAHHGWSRGAVDGIDVITLPLAYANRDGILLFLRFAVRSISIALKQDYDLLFATSTPLTAGVPGIVAKWVRGKPFVFEVRDLWPELPRALGMRNPLLLSGMSILEWASYQSAQACIGLSPGIVKGIMLRTRASVKKTITMIPNGCDLDLFKPQSHSVERIPGINEGDFVAAFTGAHGVANGLRAVLKVVAVLKKRVNRRIKLLFVGDGKEKEDLIRTTQLQNLDNCLFLDSMPKIDLAILIANIDVGLMVLRNIPAFYYGTSPNKFFDYISSGIPVVNNYPGWLADMICEHRCGIAVKPEDPEGFADALEYLSEHLDECREMGNNARRLAEERFSRTGLAAEFVSFLEKEYNNVDSIDT